MHDVVQQIERHTRGSLPFLLRARYLSRLALAACAALACGSAWAQEPPATTDGAQEPAKDAPKAETTPESGSAKSPEAGTDKAAKPAAKGSLLEQLDDGTLPPAPVAAPTPSLFQLEWHGYFRFRPDVINNGHLGMAVPDKTLGTKALTTSAIAPPLSLWPANNDPNSNTQAAKVGSSNGETALSGATIRLRLQPTLTVGKDGRIVATLDFMDNTVLGGDPDYAGYQKRPDVPLSAFTMSARAGTLNVKELYGEWRTLVGLIRVGRQASHWGLGMLAHGGGGDGWDLGRPTVYYGGPRKPADGHGYDVDSGNYGDRAAFVTKIPKLGVYTSIFYDYLSNGAQAYDPLRPDVLPRNVTSLDDVRQYGFVLMQRPLTEDDAAERQRLLETDRKPAFDWGLYSVYRTQSYDMQVGKASATLGDSQLMVRDASAGIFDLWGRFEQRLSPLRRFVAEAEGAYITGKVADVNGTAGSPDKPRTISMWGFALKSAFQDEGMGYFLDLGAASGDDTSCWGVYGDATCALSTYDGQANSKITGFKFNRAFQVDSLLFRDLIGTVTNAYYVKPTVSINAFPWYSPDMLGLDVSVMQAIAQSPLGTPGATSESLTNIGTELGARGFVGRRGQAYGDVLFAYVIPGSAFNMREGWYDAAKSQTPTNAWRLTGHLVLPF